MTAYVIIDIEVFDVVAFQEYQRLAGPLFDRYGGKFLALAGASQVLEGDWLPRRLSIMEFESVERALALYNCAEYEALKPLREKAAHTRVILLQGISAHPAGQGRDSND
jgi:uncharacterized protein (DUF1330 family)